MLQTVEVDLHGRKITLETGKVAKQANGAVVVRSGDSVVLVTACTAEEPKPGASFFPLTVDYREYTYAAGKFPGGFIKREGRPSEKEILTSRLRDRPIRPLFPEGYSHETHVIAMVLSADTDNDPSILAIIGAGAEIQIGHRKFQEILCGFSEFAILLQFARAHAGVASDLRFIFKPRLLAFTRPDDASANRRRALAILFAGNFAEFHLRHFNVQINTVEQRAGDASEIILDFAR